MRPVPWHVKGVHPEARETAFEAARRSGLSVGEWLNSVILDQAAEQGIDPQAGDHYETFNDRLDDLNRQFERLARTHTAPGRAEKDTTSQAITDALLRLDRRLAQLVEEGRIAANALERRANSVDRALANLGEARLRSAYVGGEANSVHYALAEGAAPSDAAQSSDSATQRRTEDAVDALRKDLAEIGRTVSDAMPRRAIEALEGELRALADRIDTDRHSGMDSTALAGLEQGLREVREAVRKLAPAESVVGLDQALRTLTEKIDAIAAGHQDSAGLQHLEEAIASLRGIAGHVASDDALAAVAREVRALADKFERGVPSAGAAPDILATLDGRIATIADAIESVRRDAARPASPNLDQLIKSLNDKLEQIQLSGGAQVALGGLEDRIAKLVEKLDASEARLGHLDTIERGMAELLVHLEALRANPPGALVRADAAAPAAPVETLSGDAAALKHAHSTGERRTGESLEGVQGTIGDVVDRPAMIESDLHKDQRPAAPAPQPPPAPAAPMPQPGGAPSGVQKRPAAIDPSLPADYPLEPGSGPPRARAGANARPSASPAERLASEPLRQARSATPEPDSKAGFLQAARRAARHAAQGGHMREVADQAAPASKLSQRLKSIFVGISVVALIAVGLRFAVSYLDFAEVRAPQAPALAEREQPLPAPSVAPALGSVAPPVEASSPLPAEGIATPNSRVLPVELPAPAAPPSGVIDNRSSTDPVPPATPRSTKAPADVTGALVASSIVPPVPPPPTPAPSTEAQPPSGLSKRLMTAANSGDPAAAYEVATRYAEGRGVPHNLQEAATWYERAAKGGLAPALFRLGTLYEKGNGVTKNLNEARRLYLAAAEKGNANAMHNIGVLYADGIDGKPDFKTAAQWFRKASMHGIADSQYNLAVLYARGVGIERNLSEAYRWFALAAKAGDADAAHKRDEVAARLDGASLAAARREVETWTAETEPADATTVKTPPGGWDQMEPAAKLKPRPHAQSRSAATSL
jgi:localization factor PodJL